MDETPLFRFTRIKGINNIDSNAYRFSVSADSNHQPILFMKVVENLDIDNSFMLTKRPGYASKLSGTGIHSLWSNGLKCFFVDGDSLYELLPDYTITLLRSNVNGRLAYASFNNRIYLTNNLDLIAYYLAGAIHTLSQPVIEFKLPLPPGSHIAVHYNSILVAKDDTLFISDSLCDFYDIRYGYRRFESGIDMILPVKSGIYISDQNGVWFISGTTHEEFKRYKVSDTKAIPGTGIITDSANFFEPGGGGMVAVWTSSNGIFIGDENGNVKNLTNSSYSVGDFGLGSAVLRDVSGVSHYLVSME